MKSKLSTFSDFANSLFPHETDYLVAIQQFNKPENLKILNLVNYNSKNPLNRLPYDTSIDKRAYSYIKNWITESLDNADVDLHYEWLLSIEQSVMTDSITPEQEKMLMKQVHQISPASYNFIRFYQVIQHYRDYLMVRSRIRYYAQVTNFLEKYQNNYVHSQYQNNEMNRAAARIVRQIAADDDEFLLWERLLKIIYYNEGLDGYTRYRAAVRLTILYYTNREFERLLSVYEHLDSQFKTNLFYSKRIMANYYHNRAMMHSKLNELDTAEKYGFLSIRQKKSDYLFYLVSLCGILLRNGRSAKALRLMTESIPEVKNTNSLHSRIGFASLYIKTLTANSQSDKAVSYGTTFFEGYKKEILEYRWHLFFSSFFQALLRDEKYSRVITLARRYKLVVKEKQFVGKAMYLPVIAWYTCLSEYMEGIINKPTFIDTISKSGKMLISNNHKKQNINNLLIDIAHSLPNESKFIAKELGL